MIDQIDLKIAVETIIKKPKKRTGVPATMARCSGKHAIPFLGAPQLKSGQDEWSGHRGCTSSSHVQSGELGGN